MLSGDAADHSNFVGNIDDSDDPFREYSQISRRLKVSKNMTTLVPVSDFPCWSYKGTYERAIRGLILQPIRPNNGEFKVIGIF